MSALAYYARMAKGSALNPNYIAYKSRVEADGGAIVDETITNAKFQFLDDNSLLSDVAFMIDKDGGNTISSGLVSKAYDFGSNNYDFIAASGQEPTEDYDFNETALLKNINPLSLNTSAVTVFFKTGTHATGRFDFLMGDNTGVGGSSSPRLGLRWGENPNNVLILYTRNAGQSLRAYFSTVDFALNSSYMVVFRPSSSHLIYKNGVLQQTITSTSGGNIAAIESIMNIGGWGNGPQYAGDILTTTYFNGDKSGDASIIHSNL